MAMEQQRKQKMVQEQHDEVEDIQHGPFPVEQLQVLMPFPLPTLPQLETRKLTIKIKTQIPKICVLIKVLAFCFLLVVCPNGLSFNSWKRSSLVGFPD